MKKVSTKTNTKYHQTDRKKRFIAGGVIALLLAITPFLFYLYKYAPDDSTIWKTALGTIDSGNFISVQSFVHAVFTKITFIIITALWFITSRDWWRWAILIPLTMFLFQLVGVFNFQIKYIDNFDFWYSLPVVIPVILFVVWIGHELKSVIGDLDLKEEIEEELEQYDS